MILKLILLYHIPPCFSTIINPVFRIITYFLQNYKNKTGSLFTAAPCPYPSAFLAKSPHFLFSDLELKALSLEKRGRTGSRSGVCKGHSLCPSESAVPLMLMKPAKSMSRVLWRYCWHNSKNTTAKGDYTYERKTHFPLSRQR